MSNQLYEDAFSYIGAFVDEREKLIEDGYNDETEDIVLPDGTKKTEMKQSCKEERWAQSDMIMILMNLSYIPDDVAKKINFAPGWRTEFKKNMEEYKQAFKNKTGREWEFQNKALEDDYTDYIQTREVLDTELQVDKKADEINERMNKFFDRVKISKKDKVNATTIN